MLNVKTIIKQKYKELKILITRIFKTKKQQVRESSENLLEEIKNNENNLDSNEQKSLGDLIDHIGYVSTTGNLMLLKKAEIAVASIFKKDPEPKLLLAINEGFTKKRRAPYDTWTPSLKVLMGLVVSLYLILITFSISSNINFPNELLGINTAKFFLAASCGTIGSIISIMSRVGEFSTFKHTDRMVYFFIGLFKPIIGMTFAVFIYSIIKADIIPLNMGTGTKEIFMIISISFLSGFSERFAMDFTGSAEKILTGKETNKNVECNNLA